LPIEPCDGNLSSAKTFSGLMPEGSLVGRPKPKQSSYTLYTIYSTSGPRDDRDRHYEIHVYDTEKSRPVAVILRPGNRKEELHKVLLIFSAS
jgi:hypothetical protein